jgi:hypothetical protein
VRLLQPLDLPEDKILEIDVRDISENGADDKTDNKFKIKVFEKWMTNLHPNMPNLTNKQISRESIYEEQTQGQL